MLARALRHECIGAIQDGLGGTVVLQQYHHVGLGFVALRKAENILHRRGTKRIDGLRVVADHGHALAVRLQRVEDFALQGAGILILVHQHMIEVLRQCLCQRRGLHHDVPVQQQIVEIQHVVLLFSTDVFAVKLG